MPVRLQEFIHKFEEGSGARWLKFVLAVFVVIAAAVAYDLAALRNLSTREGMDNAQLAFNIAEGRGFTTYCIRPFSIYLLNKKRVDEQPISTNVPTATTINPEAAQLSGTHPDLSNPPVYPLLLAGLFKVIQFSHPNLALQQNFRIYHPDFWIGLFNQGLVLVLVMMVFLLARSMFDESVAWASALALIGAEILWRFSLSGLPTVLLMIIFVALLGVLTRLEKAVREGNGSSRALLLLGLSAGLLVGLAGLTRYAFAWLILPVVLWLSYLAGPRRANLPMAALGAFLLVMTPWVLRNYNLSGALFGTATYAVFETTPQFPEDQLERSLTPDFSNVSSSDLWHKLIANSRDILQNDLPKLGGSWITAFFLAGLLVPFRNAGLNRLRWFLISCLVLLVLVQALGRTALTTESSPVHSENLLVVLAPAVFIFGASLFFILFEQVAAQLLSLRVLVLGAFGVVVCSPLLLTLFAPYPSALVYPPYYPPWIQEKAWSVDDKGLFMSDIPWAVAWYGQRQAVELSLKHRSRPGDRFRNDFYAVDALRPINALYLTGKTLKSLEPRSLWDWLQADPDAPLLNRLRQRVVDNQGRDDKKEEDFRVFAAVRERLVANAEQPEDKAEDWEHFVLGTFLKSEVPSGFPLKRAPEGLFPELFLMETERAKQKTIQSQK
jgi:hypothetical protein